MLKLDSGKPPLRYVCGGHFISDGEWIHKDRIRDDIELIFVVEGVLEISVDNTPYSVSPMEGLINPANKRHVGTVSTDKRVSFYWIHFVPRDHVHRDNVPLDNEILQIEQIHFRVPNPEQFLQLFRHTLQISASLLYAPEAVDYATALLLLELEAQLRMAEHQRHPKLNEICEWIRTHPLEPASASALAGHFGYNEDYLSRLFKSAFGISLKQYISKAKLRQAKMLLLTTSLPVKEIASRVGMLDEKVFYKFFKSLEGITPSHFRNSYTNVSVNMD